MTSSSNIDTSLGELERAVDKIVSRWEAPPEAHHRFRNWATQMSSELMASCSGFEMAERMTALRNEFRHLHEQLARTLVQFGHVDEGLVSRRAFVAHLIDLVEPHAPVMSTRHTFVRTAA